MVPSALARVFLVAILAFGVVAIAVEASPRLPGDHTGFTPEQPIAFSHRVHAGELRIDCQYCHYAASKSQHAGIPPSGLCMNCHEHVTSSWNAVLQERQAAESEGREPGEVVSPELEKLYASLGLGPDRKPDPALEPAPIPWVRVHDLPDHVAFDHRVHVNRGVACESCHGPVQSMERVQQVEDLSMGWCIDCHRRSPRDPALASADAPPDGRFEHHVSTDCAACHY